MADGEKVRTFPMHGRRSEASRARASVKEALMNAMDKLGNEAFFLELGRGSAEDKRCLAMIFARLIPVEVQGALDASLTVRVVTRMGGVTGHVVEGGRAPVVGATQEVPQDAALPAVIPAVDRAPAG